MAAADLAPEKRALYLQWLGAALALRGRGHFNDSDVAEAAKSRCTVWSSNRRRDRTEESRHR